MIFLLAFLALLTFAQPVAAQNCPDVQSGIGAKQKPQNVGRDVIGQSLDDIVARGWIVIAVYFYVPLSGEGPKPPDFVYAIVPTLFVFFNIFALNMFLKYKKVGRWKDYLFGERMYIVLSLLAKTLLAWQIFAGTLAPV